MGGLLFQPPFCNKLSQFLSPVAMASLAGVVPEAPSSGSGAAVPLRFLRSRRVSEPLSPCAGADADGDSNGEGKDLPGTVNRVEVGGGGGGGDGGGGGGGPSTFGMSSKWGLLHRLSREGALVFSLQERENVKLQAALRNKRASIVTLPSLLAWYLVDAEGRKKRMWDALMSVIIVYSVVVIPFRLAFEVEASGVWLYLVRVPRTHCHAPRVAVLHMHGCRCSQWAASNRWRRSCRSNCTVTAGVFFPRVCGGARCHDQRRSRSSLTACSSPTSTSRSSLFRCAAASVLWCHACSSRARVATSVLRPCRRNSTAVLSVTAVAVVTAASQRRVQGMVAVRVPLSQVLVVPRGHRVHGADRP